MKTQEEKETFLKGLETPINILDYIIDIDDINSFSDVLEVLNNNNVFREQSDIRNSFAAIEFLLKHDNTLYRSFEIAKELQYSLENLNSQVLASLLNCELITQDFFELKNEIEEFFYS